ncbi:MAG: hypothetical protein JOZ98_08615 [Solirubrobacterales bacterium]|nr:hypothetical protein [Solirubrobacterales bacterium]MBV9422958.1 hypothetical protein [Solirubrobacterales bacterium]MBV9799989.1 hypothetical protein [Solirubrobacterales bacterium]
MGAGIEVEDVVRKGVAVVIATRDAELRPELSRAWGPSLSQDGARLTVCVEAAPGSAMARNLAAGSPVAATLARLVSHTTVQLKGAPVEVAAPTPERLAAAAEHVERFIAEGERVGMPEAFARGLVGRDLLTVTIEIAERTDETPGLDTGREL